MPRGLFNKDEDIDFVYDTYQSGMSNIFFNANEFYARSAMMMKIARKRAPQIVPLLKQVEDIVAKTNNGQMKEETARKKLLEISERHGHPNLHDGVVSKVNGINGGPAAFKPLAIFSTQQKKDEHPLATFLRTEKEEKMTVKVKTEAVMGDYIALHGKMPSWELPASMRHKIPKNEIWIRKDVYDDPARRERIIGGHEQFEIDMMVERHMSYKKAHKLAERHEKQGWDPMTDEHPLALMFGAQKKTKAGWDPWKDEHPLATMMKKQQKKEKQQIPAGQLRQAKGWNPMSNEEHPLAKMFKQSKSQKSSVKKQQKKGWDPWAGNGEHPLAAMFKKGRK